MPSGMIFHVCIQAEWEKAQEVGEYRGDTLETQGFIHCSSEGQIDRIVKALSEKRNDLLLLRIAVFNLRSPTRYERSRDGELYPHVYGPIQIDAVVSADKIE